MEIRTERLKIRKLIKSDITEEYINNLNDPEINQFISTRGIEQTIESLDTYINNYSGKIFGIFLQGIHIGNITIFGDTIGILIFKGYQRRGYARESILALKEFGFEKASINEENTASLNLFKGCGFYIKTY